jgi:hypothetical protein
MSILFNAITSTTLLLLSMNADAQGGPPANDDCNTPICLSGNGNYPFDTTAATTGTQGQGMTPSCSSMTPVKKDLWYLYTSSVTGWMSLSICNLTTSPNGDTKVTLYHGAGCPSTPTGFDCDDDACVGSDNSHIKTPVTCGDLITIQLGNYSGVPTGIFGTFALHESGTVCISPSMTFCAGDAAGTTCLGCGNNGNVGRGCASSSFAAGGLLSNSGSASVGMDTLRLTATSIPGPGVFLQGNALLATPSTFGDGMLCMGFGILRIGIVFPFAGTASYPGDLTSLPVHVAGGPINAGDTKHYQFWYRDSVPYCTPGTYNMTQGLTLTWGS